MASTRTDTTPAWTAQHPPTLRWVILHMIEETARHNGHLDLLRQMADGVTGD
ncbi:MAG: mini-circle protein [Nocardioidaceae bacterium]|nr:mini-circle protein [Nocardioidaceae bacterium]